MFDIGIADLGSLLGAVATIALGLLGSFVCFILSLSAASRSGMNRVAACCAGPIVCLAIGCVSMAVVRNVNLPDEWGYAWMAAGVGGWIATALFARRRSIS